MRYECPSCYMMWSDSKDPAYFLSRPLCVFCSTKHTQKELLNWQMEHLDQIDPKNFLKILRHFYKFTDHKFKLLEEMYHNEISTIRKQIENSNPSSSDGSPS